MARRAGVWVAIALGLAACEAGWLHERGLRVIREVSVGEGARLLEDPAAVLLQVRGPGGTGLRVEGTALMADRDPLPPDLPATVVILAEELDLGLRMAARLSRAGIQEVAVVRGGVAAWQTARSAAPERAPAEAARRDGEAT